MFAKFWGIETVEACKTGEICGTEEVLILAGLGLFVLIRERRISCSLFSKIGEETEFAGFFPFPLSIELVYVWMIDFFCVLTSARNLLIIS